MALDYIFEIHTQDRDWLKQAIVTASKCDTPLQVNNALVFESRGIVCHLLKQSSLGNDLSLEYFGIPTELVIRCRLDKFDSWKDGMEKLCNLSKALVLRAGLDFIFFSEDVPLLYRKDGKVHADNTDPFWVSEWGKVLHEIEFNAEPFKSNSSRPSQT